MLLAGCSRVVNVYRASISVDGTIIVLTVAACQANKTVEIDEQVDRVVVRVRAEDSSAGDCADVTYFRLAEPLGNRPLIDASDGGEIEVTVDESITRMP